MSIADKKEEYFKKLDDIYTRLSELMSGFFESENPCGDCFRCCTYITSIPVSNFEMEYIESREPSFDRGPFVKFLKKEDDAPRVCPNWDKDKKGCLIYPYRPVVCRNYGYDPLSLITITHPDCCFLGSKNLKWPEMNMVMKEYMKLKEDFTREFIDELEFITYHDYIFMALMFKIMGKKERAVELYQKAADFYALSGEIRLEHSARAEVCLLKNDLEGAAEEYRIIMKLVPRYVLAQVNLGVVLQQLERFDEAISVLEEAATKVDLPAIFSTLGLCYSRKELHQKAIEAYDKAFQLEPKMISFRLYKAVSLEALSRFDESEEIVDEILAITPDDILALTTKIFILKKTGRISDSLNYYCRLFEVDPSFKSVFEKDYYDTRMQFIRKL